jgi:threonine dehydrogenase-like Zn-dependent dehydrogenase
MRPFWGIMKEISMQFALGYDPTEFASSLHAIDEGLIDATPMITDEAGLDGVDAAFGQPSESESSPRDRCHTMSPAW